MHRLYKNYNVSHKTINWRIIYQNLFSLQNRIVHQIERNNFRQARHLQRLILKSLSARLIASQKIIEIQNVKKFSLYKSYCDNSYLSIFNLNDYLQLENFLTNQFNSKSVNKKFLVYIQLLSLLWVFALLPISETFSNSLFYNYRLYRTQTDILNELCLVLKRTDYKWILIIKPNGFFNEKNRRWLVKNVLMEKKFLVYILKLQKFANFKIQYYKYNQEFIGLKKISITKLLKNFSFHEEYRGLKKILLNHEKSKLYSNSVFYYNNLIISPSTSLNQLRFLYQFLYQFLKNRSLLIKKNRVWVIDLSNGLNFFGWFLKKEKNTIIFNISDKNIKSHQLEIKNFLKNTKFLPIDKVILQLNKKIIKWQIYYAYSNNISQTWSKMNYYLFWRIWRWCKKKHKNKGSKWIYSRYWKCRKNQKWVFHANRCYLKSYSFKQQKIIPLPASINACKIKNLKKIKDILYQRQSILKSNVC